MLKLFCIIGLLYIINSCYGSVPYFDCKITMVPSCPPDQQKNMNGERYDEHTATGVVIYTLEAVDPDDDPVTFGKARSARVDEGFVDGYDWFHVAPDGNVSFRLDPDYDQEAKQFEIAWTLSDGSTTVLFPDIKIYLNDINDNHPVFDELIYTFYVAENAMINAFIGNVSATDIDSGANNKIVYSLTETSQVFKMEDGGNLIVKNSTLDYENVVTYTLKVNATDSGTPSQSAEHLATIRILIEDFNDVPPEFKSLPYNAKLNENEPVGTLVFDVDAIDGDKGVEVKNTILYTLINETSGHFNISEDSGKIYIADLIDKENMTESAYTLLVQATEEGTEQISETEVVVTIVDVNDNVPIFYPKSEVYKLDENTPPDNLIYLDMTVHDADEAGNNKFKLSLEGGNGTFELRQPDRTYTSESTVVLVVCGELDFEKGANNINLQINATDVGDDSGKYWSTGNVSIQIQDLNDNSPVFEDEIYLVNLPEDAQNGTHVITIVATDKDSKNITYKLIGTTSDLNFFTVSPHSGNVTVFFDGQCVFDVEQGKSSFFFTYQAKDDGDLASTVLLEISLIDVNDNWPEYVGTTPTFPTVLEGNEFNISTPIATVKFTDADKSKTTNGLVEYHLLNSSIFMIDILTGEIYQTEPADYETKHSYVLHVIAQDQGIPSLSSNVTIKIDIDDVNDNVPIFNQQIYHGEINETAKNGVWILTVNATDADSYQNRQVDYEFLSTDDVDGKFLIDRLNGEISKSGDLDWDMGQTEYNLMVTATDRGDVPLTGNCTVHITVMDTNDELPVLADDGVTISEDANVSVIVTTIKANDSDTNSKLEYFILETEAFNDISAPVEYNDDHFSLDNSTGQLSLSKALDQELIQEYRLTVQVIDVNGIGIDKQTDQAVITVHVKDIPDEPPYFWKPPETGPVVPPVKHVEVTEDVKGERHNDSCIASISSAEDDDNNDPIYLFIVDGNEECVFHLQNKTGCITLMKEVDREVQALYTLIVKATNNINYEFGQECPTVRIKATNSGFDPQNDKSLLQVEVQIVDKNDNLPVFTQERYTAGVTSTYNYGTSIIQLVANDEDEGINAKMEYQIVKETYYIDDDPQLDVTKFFAVNPTNGWITLQNLFDSEDIGYFELDVQVVGTGNFNDSATVSIYLMNPNDNQVKVVFDKASKSVKQEEETFSSVVGNATNYIINIDYINVHLDVDDKPETNRTDMRIHAVNITTNKVILYRPLITAIDEAYTIYAELKNEYRVMEVVKAVPEPLPVFDTLNLLQWFFFTFSLVLIFILSLWAIAFGFWRSSLQRKLKVANAEIYKNLPKPEKLPNTNKWDANPMYKKHQVEENDIYNEIASNTSEASEAGHEKSDAEGPEGAAHENIEDELLLILQDYDKSRGISNSALEDDSDMEVTDV